MFKFILSSMIVFASALANAADAVEVYPNCYRGTLTMTDGAVKDVFLTFGSNSDAARVKEFKIAGKDVPVSKGSYASKNEITFNNNNDYIPGGNATYNTDIYLKFEAAKVVGTYSEFRMTDGHGGYGQSDAKDQVALGAFNLKQCVVTISDK